MKDEKRNLLPEGYMIAIAPESDQLMHELETKIRAIDDIECNLDITVVTETKRDSSGNQCESFCMSKNFLLPAFSMYALFPIDQNWPDGERLSVTISLPITNQQQVSQIDSILIQDRQSLFQEQLYKIVTRNIFLHKLHQILKWMENKFLCLQILANRPKEEVQELLIDIVQSDNSIDLRLIDLKSNIVKSRGKSKSLSDAIEQKKSSETIGKVPNDISVSRIEFHARSNELSIESESIDFLSNVVRSLVLDYLGYDKYTSRSNIGSSLTDLSEKTLLAKQYEETDNRILTEFAENSKNLQSLSEQLDMANNLFEL